MLLALYRIVYGKNARLLQLRMYKQTCFPMSWHEE